MMPHTIPGRAAARAVVGAGAVVIAVALAAAGCSPAASQPGPGQASAASAAGRTGIRSAPPGTSVAVSDSSGTSLDVTLKQVIDPAGGASQYSQPAAGHHFVGVKLLIRNDAAASFENNANNETTIVLAGGKPARPA